MYTVSAVRFLLFCFSNDYYYQFIFRRGTTRERTAVARECGRVNARGRRERVCGVMYGGAAALE